MEPTWFYVGTAVIAVAGALVFRKMVGNKTIRHRLAAWSLILFGVAVLIVAALETRSDLFFIAAGLVFVVGGVIDLFAWPGPKTKAPLHP